MYRVTRALLCPYFTRRFNLRTDSEPLMKAPYMVISNHVTELDFFLLGQMFKTPMGFVISQTMVKHPLARYFLTRWYACIVKRKGAADASTALHIMRRLKAGRNVCLFAEGNTTFDGRTGFIPKATGSLLRSVKAGLVTCRIEGGYFSLPRWGKGIRRGKTRCVLVNTYPAEALSNMSADAINELLARDLYTDAYQEQEEDPVAFIGRDIAQGMEHTLYLCPSCKRQGTLVGEGDRVKCKGCGETALYTPHGTFQDGKPFLGIREWADWQKDQLRQALLSGDEHVILRDEKQSLHRLEEDDSLSPAAEGDVSMSGKALHIGGMTFAVGEITGLEIYRKNTLLFALKDGQHFQLSPKPRFNALKYRDLYTLIKRQEG